MNRMETKPANKPSIVVIVNNLGISKQWTSLNVSENGKGIH